MHVHAQAEGNGKGKGKEGNRKGTDIPTSSGGTAPPSAPAVAWSREACDDWIKQFGGTAPGGQIGKALKPLVQKHTWVYVRPAWRSYLAQADPEYASASRFAATFGRWAGALGPAPGNPTGDEE